MPFTIDDLNYDKDSKERMPWEHYTQEFATADPKEIASRLSIPYDEETKKLTLTFLGTQYQITWPDFEVTHTPDDKGFYPLENMIYARILTIRFLLNGVKSESSGKFKTYREMPWGEVYLRQFDGRCIKRLAFSYGNRPGDFRAIMEHISAIPVKHGDIAYEVEIFPEYKIQMILWEGDEEFPPSSQILFSNSEQVMYGILNLVLTTVLLNKVMLLGTSQIQLFIISEKYEEIREDLLSKLDLGTTMIYIENGYRHEKQKGVMCIIPNRKLYSTKEMIHSIDPYAFITITQINEVRGQGFTFERIRYQELPEDRKPAGDRQS